MQLRSIDTGESKHSASKKPHQRKFNAECKALDEAHADKTVLTMGADPKDKAAKAENEAEPKAEWPDSDSSDESEDSSDEISKPPIQALWLPKFYDDERERMFAHIHEGEGETSSIKQRLQKGTTDTGNVKFGIVEAEWDWLQKRFKGDPDRDQKYFCSLLALTHAMCASDHWMYDNECREQRARIIGTYDSLTGCFRAQAGTRSATCVRNSRRSGESSSKWTRPR